MEKEENETINVIDYTQNINKPNKLSELKYYISLLYRRFIHRLKDTGAVLKGLKLPDNAEYEGAPRVTQEEVESTPKKWIIEECIPACQILWEKNIYIHVQ